MNQRRAVESIRAIVLAEKEYAERRPDNSFACSLGELSGLLDQVLTSGTKSSYHFEIACTYVERQKATAYAITAKPTKPGITSMYAFCADQTGEIWYSDNGLVPDCFATRKQIERKYK